MDELKLYNIDDEYIDYLQTNELKERGFSRVSNNKDNNYKNKKPYVGIVIKVMDYHYFVPLTHPKDHYNENFKFFNRISFPIQLKNGRDYGRLMFCYMIPLKTEYIPKPINMSKIDDEKYKNMLITQYFYINSKNQREIIINKATNLYQKVYNKPSHYLYKYCCAFEILEKYCNTYKKITK